MKCEVRNFDLGLFEMKNFETANFGLGLFEMGNFGLNPLYCGVTRFGNHLIQWWSRRKRTRRLGTVSP